MTLVAAAVLVALVTGIVVVVRKKKTAPADSDPVTDKPQENNAGNDYKPILETLLQLNILVRKDLDFPEELTNEIEAIMDDLMVVIPAMTEQYPGETLTYEIKKIGKEHLFKTVKEYLDLSQESRVKQFDIFKQTIDSLKDVADRSRDIVEKNETAEFKTMANFLSSKFS